MDRITVEICRPKPVASGRKMLYYDIVIRRDHSPEGFEWTKMNTKDKVTMPGRNAGL